MKTTKTLLRSALLALMIITVSCEEDDTTPVDPPFIDLEATSIEFSVANVTPNFTADATITATITNMGEEFSTSENQIFINLLERQLGVSTGTVVDDIRPTNLAPGEQRTLSFTRPWNASSPAEGEFPPNYILEIVYDPDFGIDGNDNNNDFNFENNQLIASGIAINALILE